MMNKPTSGRRQRRVHTPEFKAKVALAALREDKTLTELCQQYALHPTQITEWRRQLLEHAADVFGRKSEEAVDLAPLHEKIGKQALELPSSTRASLTCCFPWVAFKNCHYRRVIWASWVGLLRWSAL